MGLLELKHKIQMQIENADERLLRIVSSVCDSYLDKNVLPDNENIVSEPIIAYDSTGKPLTLKQYNEEIDKGINDFKNGRFISQEDLENEVDSWYNE